MQRIQTRVEGCDVVFTIPLAMLSQLGFFNGDEFFALVRGSRLELLPMRPRFTIDEILAECGIETVRKSGTENRAAETV